MDEEEIFFVNDRKTTLAYFDESSLIILGMSMSAGAIESNPKT
jgi:hypothetical protein